MTVSSGPGPPHCRGFTITLRHTTLDRKPLDEGSGRRRPLPDNTQHSQQTDDHGPGGTGARNPARERSQTHTVDGAATGTGSQDLCSRQCSSRGTECPPKKKNHKPTSALHTLELKAVFMPKDERQILNGFPDAYARTSHCSPHHLISDALRQGRLIWQ